MTGLASLPSNIVKDILCKHLDPSSRVSFFHASKHTTGAVVLAVCRPKVFLEASSTIPTRVLRWAAQLSHDMELNMRAGVHVVRMADLLNYLTMQGGLCSSVGAWNIYPGITTMKLDRVEGNVLLPSQLLDTFPNLQHISYVMFKWTAGTQTESQAVAQAMYGGSAQQLHATPHRVQHLGITLDGACINSPAAFTHIADQLSHLTSLTSLTADDSVLQATPASVLAKLTKLEIRHSDVTNMASILQHCSNLHSLAVYAVYACNSLTLLDNIPQLLSQLQELEMNVDLTDGLTQLLLDYGHSLKSLTFDQLDTLTGEYTSANCTWRRLQFRYSINDSVCRLPLRTLDAPVLAHMLCIAPRDAHHTYSAFMQSAQSHLVRCGGIQSTCTGWTGDGQRSANVGGSTHRVAVTIDFSKCLQPLTQPEAEQIIKHWATCITSPGRVCLMGHAAKSLATETVAAVWPDATRTSVA